MRLFIQIILVTTMLLLGCGAELKDERQQAELKDVNDNSLRFLEFGDSWLRSSSLMDVRKEEFTICLSGQVSQNDYERSLAWSREAVLIWLRTLKMIDEKVTDKIAYSCTAYDLIFYLRSGSGTSYAQPSKINVYMSRGFGTWTHELGHALGSLADTYYAGGSAGKCQPGQPESLMCWGMYGPKADKEVYSTLWQDDVDGVRKNYKKIFGNNLTAPSWAEFHDPYLPVNTQYPWPGFGGDKDGYNNEQFSVRHVDTNVVVDPNMPDTEFSDEGIDL